MDKPLVFTIGASTARDWPFLFMPETDHGHTKVAPYGIRFDSPREENRPLYLLLGLTGVHTQGRKSKVAITVGGQALPLQEAPYCSGGFRFLKSEPGPCETIAVAIPPGRIHKGQNVITIGATQGRLVFDYVALSTKKTPLPIQTLPPRDLLAEFRKGPLAAVEDIVFAVRTRTAEGHYYANFGYEYYSTTDPPRPLYGHGGRLCRLHLASKRVTTLLDDPDGAVRDPVVHYDAGKTLFSYRKGGSEHYHLFEIGVDGTGLRQLTDGPFDDIEPCYLPADGIVFVSSRCNRFVNCWKTPVAVLHRCDGDGRNIRRLSSNVEHDNTPWVLPDGRVLYTRWEYVDRNQLMFHHLWTMNPDGTRQMVFYGNQEPGTVMLDAKPVPHSPKIVASFSPGHGAPEHEGALVMVDPRLGPDDPRSAVMVSHGTDCRDPWAFSEDAFLAVRSSRAYFSGEGLHEGQIVLMDGKGRMQTIYELPKADRRIGLEIHEPRPLVRRPREARLADTAAWDEPSGLAGLVDVYQGRNMAGVRRGEIKKLLVLETLPKPVHFHGGMEPITYGGSFTLERLLGTVPVEPDGSAFMELPALRSLFFVALDEKGDSVKRMQSFLNVMPGETATCIGCHERRTVAPSLAGERPAAFQRRPSKIEPLPGVPEVFDYPRDIQPILDRHCVRCHNAGQLDGGVNLTGDRGPQFSLSYFTMIARNLIADGRNGYRGNHAPRTIGSSASRLLPLTAGRHYAAKVSGQERQLLIFWIESGAVYPGTYAAEGMGTVGDGVFAGNAAILESAVEALHRRCGDCHQGPLELPKSPFSDHLAAGSQINFSAHDARRRFSCHLLSNLSHPAASLLLQGPLAKRCGGYQSCGKPIFADTADPDYQKLLQVLLAGKKYLDAGRRFDRPGFMPSPNYVREMKRYGILPEDQADDSPIDAYATDRRYWRSFWHRPPR